VLAIYDIDITTPVNRGKVGYLKTVDLATSAATIRDVVTYWLKVVVV
jgi:hypothetical protein